MWLQLCFHIFRLFYPGSWLSLKLMMCCRRLPSWPSRVRVSQCESSAGRLVKSLSLYLQLSNRLEGLVWPSYLSHALPWPSWILNSISPSLLIFIPLVIWLQFLRLVDSRVRDSLPVVRLWRAFIELWNCLGWKVSLRSLNLILDPALPCLPLSHIPEWHIYTSFQCLHHFPRQPFPVQNFFPISNLNFPWHDLRPFPLVLSLVRWEKRPTPPWLQPPFTQL